MWKFFPLFPLFFTVPFSPRSLTFFPQCAVLRVGIPSFLSLYTSLFSSSPLFELNAPVGTVFQFFLFRPNKRAVFPPYFPFSPPFWKVNSEFTPPSFQMQIFASRRSPELIPYPLIRHDLKTRHEAFAEVPLSSDRYLIYSSSHLSYACSEPAAPRPVDFLDWRSYTSLSFFHFSRRPSFLLVPVSNVASNAHLECGCILAQHRGNSSSRQNSPFKR